MNFDRLTCKEIIRALGDNIVDLDAEVATQLRAGAAESIRHAVLIGAGNDVTARAVLESEFKPLSPPPSGFVPMVLTPLLKEQGWTQEDIDTHNATAKANFDAMARMQERPKNYNPRNATGAEFAQPDLPPDYRFEVVAVGERNVAGDLCIKQDPTENPRIPKVSVYQCSRDSGHVYHGNNPAVRGCPQCALSGASSSGERDNTPDDERW